MRRGHRIVGRRRAAPPRVVVGLTQVAGHHVGLVKGFERLGARATLVDLSPDRFGYRAGTRDSPDIRLLRWAMSPRLNRFSGVLAVGMWLIRVAVRLAVLGRLVLTHDVFLFTQATTFFEYRELPVLRRLRKTVIHEFLGSDCRPAYLSGALPWVRSGDLDACLRHTRRQQWAIGWIERHATVVINHPPQAQLCRRPFVPFLKLGFAKEPPDLAAAPVDAADGRVRILHCPSNPAAKGTAEIRATVEMLRDRGCELHYEEVVGRPNAEVLQAIARTDILVDQAYADTPMAGLATEAAWLRRAVVVAGYAQDAARVGLDPEEVPPTVYCRPDELADRLEELVRDADLRAATAQAAHQYVRTRWGPEAVARRYLMLARGEFPAGWLVDPRPVDYALGCGLPAEGVRSVLAAIVAQHGADALLVADKPPLQRQLLALAAGAPAG